MTNEQNPIEQGPEDLEARRTSGLVEKSFTKESTMPEAPVLPASQEGDIWDPAQEPPPPAPKVYRKISLCTACMNRLHDLMVTLPVNIYHNRDYPKIEFVVLNYNSKDKLDEWMRDYMLPYIRAGILVYVHTVEPEFFAMSHSRNVAFKVATGDIINNVDADNFTGRGFAEALNLLAEVRPEKAVFTGATRLTHGRLGFYKNDWQALGGYDESLVGYGWEDNNLLLRAMKVGFKVMAWRRWKDGFDERIPTSNEDSVRYLEHKYLTLTECVNMRTTYRNLARGRLVANEGKPWGKARLTRNFGEVLEL